MTLDKMLLRLDWDNRHFLLFPGLFCTLSKIIFVFEATVDLKYIHLGKIVSCGRVNLIWGSSDFYRYGKCHPMVALQQYRSFSGKKDAKLAVCGMCATEFSIADSSDPNMLDIVGFDSAAPRVLSWFASGRI